MGRHRQDGDGWKLPTELHDGSSETRVTSQRRRTVTQIMGKSNQSCHIVNHAALCVSPSVIRGWYQTSEVQKSVQNWNGVALTAVSVWVPLCSLCVNTFIKRDTDTQLMSYNSASEQSAARHQSWTPHKIFANPQIFLRCKKLTHLSIILGLLANWSHASHLLLLLLTNPELWTVGGGRGYTGSLIGSLTNYSLNKW